MREKTDGDGHPFHRRHFGGRHSSGRHDGGRHSGGRRNGGRPFRRSRTSTGGHTGRGGSTGGRHPAREPGTPTGVLAGRRGRYARLVPALLLVMGSLVELVLPPDVTVSAFFASAPVVAAALQSARATLLTGVAATSAIAAFSVIYDAPFGLQAEARVLTVLAVSVIALGVNAILRHRVAELASVRIVAEAVQLAVLPVPPSRIGGLSVAAHYRAAQADARIGGDFYVVEKTPYGVRLLLGDVRGKGLGAVEAVVVVVGAFREAADQEATLAGVAGRLDRALQRLGSRRRGEAQYEGFTTAVLVEVPDPCESSGGSEGPRVMRLVNRGHPGPILLDGGRASVLEPTVRAVPLGMTGLGVWPDSTDEVRFPLGAHLLLYTDGLSESRDEEGAFYEPQVRLAGRRFREPDEVLRTLVAEVEAHTGGAAEDDMALLAVSHGTGSSVTVRSGKGQLR